MALLASRHPNLPLSLDDSAEGTHDDLPLAILRALVEALRVSMAQQDLPAHVIRPMRGFRSAATNLFEAKLPEGPEITPYVRLIKRKLAPSRIPTRSSAD
jgi:hypothetical protein